MTFTKFHLEFDSDCENDHVIVIDDYGMTKICDSNKDRLRIFSSDSQLRIFFYSNKDIQGDGFKAVFYALGE